MWLICQENNICNFFFFDIINLDKYLILLQNIKNICHTSTIVENLNVVIYLSANNEFNILAGIDIEI